MDIKIRRMQPDDAMQVAEMNQRLSHYEEGATRADAAFFRENATGSGKIVSIWVAADDKKIAGFIACRDWASFGMKAKVRQIDLLYINEDYRGFGIATDLLEFVKLDAIEHECRRMDIQTEASNEDSNALYKKLGFEIKPDTRNHYRIFLD